LNRASAQALDFSGAPLEYTLYISIKSGEVIQPEIKIKNTGAGVWKASEAFLETGPFLRSFSQFKNDSWLKYYCPARLDKDVKPGETAVFKPKFVGPAGISGEVQENYQIVISGYPVTGTLTRIFFKINESQAAAPVPAAVQGVNQAPPSQGSAASEKANADFCAALTQDEKKNYAQCNTSPLETDTAGAISGKNIISNKIPVIRIGLYNSTLPQTASLNRGFDVYSGKKIILSGLSANEKIKVSYDANNSRYTVQGQTKTLYATDPIRLISSDINSVASLPDFDSRKIWNSYYLDNLFRGIIEFNYSRDTGKFWVINELPIEHYLKGLAETSDYSPLEFQKVIITAARTYALYHYYRGIDYGISDGSTKHAKEHFHVDATYDQVYRGYRSELRMPGLSRAVDETSGRAVAHKGQVVVTPYFSRSDGRTRAWEEVWYGGPKPWLVSVPVPEDKGQTLWGHGVGLSARGALVMARDKKMKWQEILKYFYTGIEIKNIY